MVILLPMVKFGVSIHAPVMGAKVPSKFTIDDYTVSIHAPVMGAKQKLTS